MAETLGTVVGVVAFGLNLATTLQTYTELTREANDALHDVVFEVNATASALRQLQAVVDADKAKPDLQGSEKVLKESGVCEIENLAAKCETVYKTIVKLVQKASGSESDPPDATAASQHALDPASLKPMTVFQRLRWPWLTPRIERCQQQLRWLKISLLVTLQVANLALQQMRRDNDPISTQGDTLTEVVHTLQERQVELAKKLAGVPGASVKAAVNTQASAATFKTETDSSEAGSIVRGRPHLTEAAHVAAKAEKINGAEQAVATEASPIPGTRSGAGLALFQATDVHDASVDELKKPPSTRDPGIGTGGKTQWPIGNPSVSEQLGILSSYAHAFHAPGVALTKAVESESRGLPEHEAGAAAATNREPPSATMATSQVAHEPASLEIQRKAPEPLPKPAHVKMHSKASEPSKKRRTIPLVARFRKVPDLQSRLFGEDDNFSHDAPSRTLEAFVAEHGKITKVPFGHDRLMYGLNQVHKHRRTATWAKYLNSSAEKQALIGKITDMAKRTSHRAMSLLTFHEIERPDGSDAILAFFALNQLQEPVTFIDAEQHRHSIPFGACQSHEGFHEFVLEMHRDRAGLPESLSKGEFERQARYDSFEAVHPMLWSASVSPGTILRMAGHVPISPNPNQWALGPRATAPPPVKSDCAAGYDPVSYARRYRRVQDLNSSFPGLERRGRRAPVLRNTKEQMSLKTSETASDGASNYDSSSDLSEGATSDEAMAQHIKLRLARRALLEEKRAQSKYERYGACSRSRHAAPIVEYDFTIEASDGSSGWASPPPAWEIHELDRIDPMLYADWGDDLVAAPPADVRPERVRIDEDPAAASYQVMVDDSDAEAARKAIPVTNLASHDDFLPEPVGVDQDDSVSDEGLVVDFDAEVARGIVSVRELLSRLTNAPSATT